MRRRLSFQTFVMYFWYYSETFCRSICVSSLEERKTNQISPAVPFKYFSYFFIFSLPFSLLHPAPHHHSCREIEKLFLFTLGHSKSPWRHQGFFSRKRKKFRLLRGSIKFAYPNCYVFYLINNEAKSELYANSIQNRKLYPRRRKKFGSTFVNVAEEIIFMQRAWVQQNEINSKSLHNSNREVDDEENMLCIWTWDEMRFGNRHRHVDSLAENYFCWVFALSARNDKHEKFQQFSTRTNERGNFSNVLWIVKNFLHFHSIFSIFSM